MHTANAAPAIFKLPDQAMPGNISGMKVLTKNKTPRAKKPAAPNARRVGNLPAGSRRQRKTPAPEPQVAFQERLLRHRERMQALAYTQPTPAGWDALSHAIAGD